MKQTPQQNKARGKLWVKFFDDVMQIHKQPCILMLNIKENGEVELIGALSTKLEETMLDYIG